MNTCIYCDRPAPDGELICPRPECKTAMIRENRRLAECEEMLRIQRERPAFRVWQEMT